MRSEYLHWSKTQSDARFNLALSGVANLTLGELPVECDDWELNGPSRYGYAPLQQAIARHYGVDPGCVCAVSGASTANHLVMASVVQSGDEVLIEHPAYEPLISTARYLGAKVKRFPRRFEDGFQLDLAEVKRALTRRTRLMVLTNLHNPSSVLVGEPVLRELGEMAQDLKAYVLVDEVYLEALFEQAPRSAFCLGRNFVATNSLTKVYGLSGLRCGWALARPELIDRMWRLNDLFGVIPAHPAERLSVVAFRHLERIRGRSQALLAANHRLLAAFLAGRMDLEVSGPGAGTVVFPRLRTGRVEEFCRLLRQKYETTVAPGKFFGMADHIRIGIGGETACLAAGLGRLEEALNEHADICS